MIVKSVLQTVQSHIEAVLLCEMWKKIFLEIVSKTIWRLWLLSSSIGYLLLLPLFCFSCFGCCHHEGIYLFNLFHLFVYSLPSIISNFPWRFALSAGTHMRSEAAALQAPHISFWVTTTRFNTAVCFQYVIHTCGSQTFPQSLGIGVWRTHCVPHTW